MRNRIGRLLLGAALVALIPFGNEALADNDLHSLPNNFSLPRLADLPVAVRRLADLPVAVPTADEASVKEETADPEKAQEAPAKEETTDQEKVQEAPDQIEPDQTETAEEKKPEEAPAEEEETAEEEPPPEAEFHGDIVGGWNFFIKRPRSGYRFGPTGVPLTARQTNSIAKFVRFGDIPQGPFLSSVNLGYVSADGQFLLDVHAKDIVENDQNYELRLRQPGVHDFLFQWDQIPYLASTSGKTLFNTSNPASLTVPNAAVRAALQGDSAPWTASNNAINSNVRRIELKTERDIARVVYGFKPDPAWDFRVSYAHEDKSGTQAFGTVLNGFNALEIPGPVDYTTHTFGATAQYMGLYGDNKRYNVSFAYAGSIFDNHHNSVTYDNPFRLTPPAGNNTSNLGRNGLPPDNYANRYALTAGVDLPFDSRYMGTVTFNQMRQNQDFIAKTINPTIVTSALPATSLHGKIDTLLVNNVLSTSLTSDLTSTLRYRYYDVNNDTPELLFTDYVRGDGQLITEDIRNLSPKYTKQNASIDLNWRAMDWLNLGASYAWEQYDRTRRDANVTNEHTGKVTADASPFDWVRMRASYQQAYRRYNNYDALAFVGIPAYPPAGTNLAQSSLIRKLDMANRDRQKLEASFELTTPVEGLVVTPTGSWEKNKYSDGSSSGGDLGLKRDTTWSAGVEIAFAPTTEVSLLAGYLHEDMNRALVNSDVFNCGGVVPSPACDWGSRIHDVIDTVYAGANFQLMPDSLFLKLSYAYSQSLGRTATYPLGASGITSSPQYPDVKNYTHALRANLRYKMDPELVQRLGWVDNVTVSLNYTFAYNKMNNWQINDITPYMVSTDAGASKSLFLGMLNPNYVSHYVGLTTEIHW